MSHRQFVALVVENGLPNARVGNCRITSDRDKRYNCIAWAVGDGPPGYWWWPSPGSYWPDGVVKEETKEAFVKAFETQGYRLCEDGKLEAGRTKIALFCRPDEGVPTHAARQLKNGNWTSKLGGFYDIEHDSLDVIAGPTYGQADLYLSRAD